MGLDTKAENLRGMDPNPNRNVTDRLENNDGYVRIARATLDAALAKTQQLPFPAKGIVYIHEGEEDSHDINEAGITE